MYVQMRSIAIFSHCCYFCGENLNWWILAQYKHAIGCKSCNMVFYPSDLDRLYQNRYCYFDAFDCPFLQPVSDDFDKIQHITSLLHFREKRLKLELFQ